MLCTIPRSECDQTCHVCSWRHAFMTDSVGGSLTALLVFLQESLSSLRSDQTTIIVAHRLSTVMDADIIIVMQVAHASSKSTLHLTWQTSPNCSAELLGYL